MHQDFSLLACAGQAICRHIVLINLRRHFLRSSRRLGFSTLLVSGSIKDQQHAVRTHIRVFNAYRAPKAEGAAFIGSFSFLSRIHGTLRFVFTDNGIHTP